jgi:uncharacterized protein YjbI with pentapeptide repeats
MEWLRKLFSPVEIPPDRREPGAPASAPAPAGPEISRFTAIRDVAGNILLETVKMSLDEALLLAAAGRTPLDSADLARCTLKGESLRNVTGSKIVLDGSSINGCMTGASLQEPSFRKARFLVSERKAISGCKLPGADFSDAHMSSQAGEIVVTDSELDGSKFDGFQCSAHLAFLDTSLKGADFSRIHPGTVVKFDKPPRDPFHYAFGGGSSPGGCDLDGARLPGDRLANFAFVELDSRSRQNVTLVFDDGTERAARLTTAGPIFTDTPAPPKDAPDPATVRQRKDRLDGVRAAREIAQKPGSGP